MVFVPSEDAICDVGHLLGLLLKRLIKRKVSFDEKFLFLILLHFLRRLSQRIISLFANAILYSFSIYSFLLRLDHVFHKSVLQVKSNFILLYFHLDAFGQADDRFFRILFLYIFDQVCYLRKVSNILLQLVLVVQLLVLDLHLCILRADLDASTHVHFSLGELEDSLVDRFLHVLIIMLLQGSLVGQSIVRSTLHHNFLLVVFSILPGLMLGFERAGKFISVEIVPITRSDCISISIVFTQGHSSILGVSIVERHLHIHRRYDNLLLARPHSLMPAGQTSHHASTLLLGEC